MYRYLIEHPRWIPPADLAKIDVRAGAGLGRIYRVRPADKPLRPWLRLDKLDTAGLVAALDSPNGWQRDMAMMMLVWKNDPKPRRSRWRSWSARPKNGLAPDAGALHARRAMGPPVPRTIARQQSMTIRQSGSTAIRLSGGEMKDRR